MLTLSITCEGRTFDDLALALEEIQSKVTEEYTSGMDHNEDGSYLFNILGQEEEE